MGEISLAHAWGKTCHRSSPLVCIYIRYSLSLAWLVGDDRHTLQRTKLHYFKIKQALFESVESYTSRPPKCVKLCQLWLKAQRNAHLSLSSCIKGWTANENCEVHWFPQQDTSTKNVEPTLPRTWRAFYSIFLLYQKFVWNRDKTIYVWSIRLLWLLGTFLFVACSRSNPYHI